MPLDLTTPADDPTGAYATILEAVTRAPDPAASLRVTTWILAEMADTFALLAFANACDACDEAGTPHPDKPGPGGNYADGMAEAGVPDDVRADAERAAVRLYAAILAAPGGYDPAPALFRWNETNIPTRHWRVKTREMGARVHPEGREPEAAARCWGHYAVMSAVGHGVSWEDDNEPLTAEPGTPLERPGYGLRVYAEDVTWSDEYVDAARVVLAARELDREDDERAAEIEASRREIDEDRALDERNEERAERASRAARTRGDA